MPEINEAQKKASRNILGASASYKKIGVRLRKSKGVRVSRSHIHHLPSISLYVLATSKRPVLF